MRKGLLVLSSFFFAIAPVIAQSSLPTAVPRATLEFQGPDNTPKRPIIESRPAENRDSSRIWARGDYLLWWVKGAPLPVPLVTTGDPAVGFPGVNSAGAIDQPSTRVLLGGSSSNFGAFSGMRFILGAWLDTDQTVGVEGSGFLLERRSNQFVAGSDAAGNPPLYFPAFNVVTQGERGLAISDPLRLFSGDVFVTSTIELWGAELNGVFNVRRRPGLELNLLAGFRYADLKENLSIHNTTNDLVFINTTVANDQFDTRNQFYGGQLGGRVSWQRERLTLDMTTKVALGATHQVVNVQGNISQSGPGAVVPGTFPGGIYAQPTNMGRRSANQFTVLPAVEFKAAYQVTPRVRTFVGYDFMYWNQVVRPGNQIDRNVNQSQSPIFGGGALVGPAAPTPLFNRTDFWAHGLSFGIELRF